MRAPTAANPEAARAAARSTRDVPARRSLLLLSSLTAAALLEAGCDGGRRNGTETTTAAPVATPSAAAAVPDAAAPAGITLETVKTITLVRIDPSHFRLRLLTAKAEGRRRRAPDWAKEFGLVAVVNASMYEPSGQSVGFMVDGATVNQAHDLSKMGGYFAFSPTRAGLPEAAAFGRDCPGFDLPRIRADYKVVFQNYRLLDCDGHAVPWKESRVFSAAAIGIDRDGRVVLAHTRAPYAMTDFAAVIAAPELRLAQMFYVEGGPEASLFVEAGPTRVRGIGDYETTFFRRDANDEFWELPNVVGVAAK